MISQDVGLWGLFISAFVSSTIAPGGSEAVLAYLVSSAQYSNVSLIIIASIGNTSGAFTTWWLGSVTAKKYPVEKLLAVNKQNAINTVKKWGSLALLFSWLPVVGDAFCFAAGWIKLPLWLGGITIAVGKTLRYIFVVMLFV